MSYPNGSGGTLTLPSPTHIHSVRSLRRAIARSPSKARQASTTPAGSPQSLSSLTVSLQQPSLGETSTPLKPNERLSARSLRSSRPVNRPISRTRMPQKSPLRRVFGSHRDSGNPIPPSMSAPEARPRCGSHSSRSPSPIASPVASPVHHTEVTLIMDHATLGSPVPAKRRSLGVGANLLDDPPAASHASDDDDIAPKGYELRSSTRRTTPPQDSGALRDVTSLPKRTTSLRKSTLQQRHDDQRNIPLSRRVGEKQMNQAAKSVAPATGTNRTRPRLSLDQYLPPDDRGSPFTQAPLPSASVHPLPRPPAQRHPLSRTITQSSSGSSLPDESPTHPPVSLGEKPRVPLNFSKSLPLGARPLGAKIPPPVATPKYKRAKPHQAAFMSTGLVSKMNRNPEAGPPKRPGDTSGIMPDTPCKKQPYDSSTFPPKPLESVRRQSRLSFGTAASPLPDASGTPRGSPFAPREQSASLFFKQVRGKKHRRASLLSFEGEDAGGSPESDDYPPPTPTKSLFKSQSTPAHPQMLHMTPTVSRFTHSTSAFGIGTEHSTPSANSGLESPLGPHSNNVSDRPTTADGEPSSAGIKDSTPMSQSLPSFTMRRGRGNSFTTPAPVKTTITEASEKHTPDSASPLNPRNPKTPSETMGPPDGSYLSVSNVRKGNLRFARSPSTPTTLVGPGLPSATPEGLPLAKGQNRRVSSTPQNLNAPSHVDEALYSRFDKAEVIGGGAFSQVYRVVKRSTVASFTSSFTSTPGQHSPEVEKVYAVKKIAYSSEKQRESKMREVKILKALSTSDKIVHYVDSWEQKGCLYIQTEYCTEGSLDAFLREVGQNGRMDDFRIWKTLLELSQGLTAIHSAGFIHLDLKPANILIGFDGYLKIGDFGFAVPWPAPKGVEGEGDREYIGPEILLGKYDKPADIFALGLIILEIACNVYLPDNGPTWQALRNGDLTVVPSLTSGEASNFAREGQAFNDDGDMSGVTYDPSNLFGGQRRGELQEPPKFMMDAEDPHSLDSVVRWMIQPEPANRPTAEDLLKIESVDWVACRRTAGATIYEGNWGLEIVGTTEQFDTQMTDV